MQPGALLCYQRGSEPHPWEGTEEARRPAWGWSPKPKFTWVSLAAQPEQWSTLWLWGWERWAWDPEEHNGPFLCPKMPYRFWNWSQYQSVAKGKIYLLLPWLGASGPSNAKSLGSRESKPRGSVTAALWPTTAPSSKPQPHSARRQQSRPMWGWEQLPWVGFQSGDLFSEGWDRRH